MEYLPIILSRWAGVDWQLPLFRAPSTVPHLDLSPSPSLSLSHSLSLSRSLFLSCLFRQGVPVDQVACVLCHLRAAWDQDPAPSLPKVREAPTLSDSLFLFSVTVCVCVCVCGLFLFCSLFLFFFYPSSPCLFCSVVSVSVGFGLCF